MKLEDLGEIALKQYKVAKYFPFGNLAASPYILTSDPLGYLEAYLNSKILSIQKDKKGQRKKFEKAIYFTQLSADFYNSSRLAKMPSKGTLLYYSFINLVKVFLLCKGMDLETKMEHHGVSLPSAEKTKLKLLSSSTDGISIFHEFAEKIGKKIDHSSGLDIDLNDILKNIPEVHEIGFALDLFNGTKRKFLPVQISIRTDKTRKKIYYTISYEKKFNDLMKVSKLESEIFKLKLDKLNIEDDKSNIHFRSKKTWNYTNTSEKSWKICYPKIVEDISAMNICPMITRDGYRFYLDLEPYKLHRLSSLLAFAFYIGTVARYRPTLNEEILKGKYQSIINEAIIACPNQFFYLMVSHITNQVLAIPKSKID